MYQIFKCKIKSFKALKIILIKNLSDMEICLLNKINHPKAALEKIKFDYIKFLCSQTSQYEEFLKYFVKLTK